MHDLIERMLAEGPVVTDGAWGTQLQQRGLAVGACPDEWNLSNPEMVQQVPRAYVDAGSQIVLTNTFRANRVALAEFDLADKVVEINQAAAAISLRAADGRAHVFGSIGPCGKMLLAGQVSAAELQDAFLEQAQALDNAGVDGLVVETMSDLEEAKIALAAAKSTGRPVVCCMVYDSGKQLDRTMMGTTVEQAGRELAEAGADVVGANCGQGIESYVEVCRQMRAVTKLPIWIKANAGLPRAEGDQIFYDTTAQQFAEFGPTLVEAGASFLGGCCGTGPDFVAALKARLRSS